MTTSTPRTAAGRIHVSLAQPGDVVHAGRFRHVHVETTSRPLAGKWRVITGTVGTSAVVIRLDANAEVVLVIRPRQYQPTPEMLYGLIAETARTVGHLEAVVGDLDDGLEVEGYEGNPFAREDSWLDLQEQRAKLDDLMRQAGIAPVVAA